MVNLVVEYFNEAMTRGNPEICRKILSPRGELASCQTESVGTGRLLVRCRQPKPEPALIRAAPALLHAAAVEHRDMVRCGGGRW